MNKYFMYGNGGGIHNVIASLENNPEYYTTLKDCFENLVALCNGAYSIKDLTMDFYTFDERINKDVYVIGTKRYRQEDYIKEYGCPQFVQYLVEL